MKALFFGLFSIAVAAAAAFGAHQYLQGEKGFLAPWMKGAAGPAIAVEAEEPSPEMIARKTQRLFQLVEDKDRASASRRATALLDQVDHAYEALMQDPQLDDAKLRELRTSTLHAKYAGAMVNRAELGEPFRNFTERLITERPKSNEAAQAAMLQLLVKHDLCRPAAAELFSDLDDYTATYPQSLGLMLFCRVAEELVKNGQAEFAKAVLQRGIRTYQSTPAGRELVRLSADLHLDNDSVAGLTQADWDKTVLALQHKVSAAGAAAGAYSRLRRT